MLALFALVALTDSDLTPARLRCEYLLNPVGIDERTPRLSWIVESGQRDAKQRAYRIEVATSPENLRTGKDDLWDSGRVASSQTVNVAYAGQPLQSGQRAWWRVTVWENGASRTSAPAFWEAGIVNPGDWKAQWVSLPDAFSKPADMSKAKWIWYPEGDPARDAPTGVTRQFRTQVDLPSGEITQAVMGFAADDKFRATVNGQAVSNGGGWTSFTVVDVKRQLHPGNNAVAVDGINDTSRAGVAVVGRVTYADGREVSINSDGRWQASTDGSTWVDAKELAPLGGAPFGRTKWAQPAYPAPIVTTSIQIPKPVRRARAYVTAKGLYRLLVDGKPVGKSFLTPGWTDYRKRIQYQTYDVTSMLKTGARGVGLVLGDGWYCGHVGLTGGQNYGDKPEGLAQIEVEYRDGTHETFASDSSWKAGTGPILSNDLLMGETYDARVIPGNWKPVETRPVGEIPLVAQRSPTVEKLEELKPRRITEPKPGSFVYDLGQNMVGWARLRVRGKAGDTVQLRFAEMLNPDGTVYTTNLRGAKATDTYTLRGGGTEVYEPSFTFHGFRYVEVTGYPGKPGRGAITGVVVGSNNPKSGTFQCSDQLVNQLQHNIFWGQRGNYLEVPTDCPQRDERLGWMGDAQIFARTACFNNDVAAFLEKWTQDVIDAQSPQGGFSDVSPRMGDQSDGAPAWGDAGVIVPWTVYRCYGDTRLLERSYPAMQAWISYIDSVNPDHIWVKRSNNNFGDWLNVQDDTPREVLATAYFAYSTDLLARSARVIGKLDDAHRYEALRDSIRTAFNDRFVDSEGKIKGDTQTAYVLALAFDLLPPHARPGAAQRLANHILIDRKGHLSTGFVGVGYLNPTLTAMGRSDIAYKLLLNDTYPSWGYSIRQGATTIWERWDGWTQEKGFQNPGMNSFNHYSLGSVGEWMYRTVAGIDMDPVVPGYERIVVRPIPGGGMTWGKGSLDSIRGRISTSWRRSGQEFSLAVTVPANTTALVYVPTSARESVHADGGRFRRMEGEAAVYEVGGGTYRFTSQLK
ncbi:family 78 glycoside hydrolase catalytic domain [Fimbriimonas ginsengisoli]|uniref:alpha-L-rhamnosidase n=1 Tax=Fimbriimonas ginsengisoli Gsoil 348 TaxID=661478 RepID=A0A068NMF9_FIMGI|nr:family 78 glycoside hydrolase catalytic domain [Fimbriimonas ginsengisoli]AIE84641.1 Alfa-L-rhamnosidase [Fimbriimonas ginsengisoli Gsoil 348]